MTKNSQIIPTKFMSVFAMICCIALVGFSTIPGQNPINDIIEGIGGSSEGIITGIVTDAETNDPIPNALMTLKYHDVVRTELTDLKGQYTFTDVPICFCLKNVSASKTGYESQYKLVSVHKITYVNFSLKPIDNSSKPTEGIITGVVTDAETNDPITDVLMTLKYHDVVRTELTDPNGWYTFTDVPICFCLKNVSASKSGYEGQYQLVAVSEMTYVNFSLNPESDAGSNTFSSETASGIISIGSIGNVLMISGVLCALLLLVIGAHMYTNRKKSVKKN